MIGVIDMSPRGGVREAGEGKKLGRPTGSGSGRKRQGVIISLQPEELERLDAICSQMNVNRSDFVRFAMKHSGVLLALKQES